MLCRLAQVVAEESQDIPSLAPSLRLSVLVRLSLLVRILLRCGTALLGTCHVCEQYKDKVGRDNPTHKLYIACATANRLEATIWIILSASYLKQLRKAPMACQEQQ